MNNSTGSGSLSARSAGSLPQTSESFPNSPLNSKKALHDTVAPSKVFGLRDNGVSAPILIRTHRVRGQPASALMGSLTTYMSLIGCRPSAFAMGCLCGYATSKERRALICGSAWVPERPLAQTITTARNEWILKRVFMGF